ncbi:MAG TPA: RNase H-like domain-containing protein, partial [Candidatus Sulfotelmatobacter sp.]|nr:RNase H-like domain-containing protein [Candidatus Sulfotelmatobacter sp.]
MISEKGIRMDPAKVAAITTWPVPRSVHDIQVFLGFANFYRRFIDKYSRIASAITALLKKGVPFLWTPKAQAAFENLKKAFTTAPILRHFDQSRPAIIETDASDYAEGGVLSQLGDDGELHPCAFFSRKFKDAEINYEIYDKEMMAIVDCMETWRHHLEGSGHRATVYSDHKNLLWFTETKVLNRRQARWAEKLSRFDFVIVFRPGKDQGKPDALSRRPDYSPRKGGDREMQGKVFLKPSQVDTSHLANPSPTLTLNTAAAQTTDTDDDLAQAIKTSLADDPNLAPHLDSLRNPELPRTPDVQEYLEPFSMQDDLVLYNGLVYVPQNDLVKTKIVKTCHDSVTAGHPGQAKTLELVNRDYHWPRMHQFVNEYVNSCDTCCRNKAPRQQPHGQLHPLPIPAAPWSSVSMDFIVELPMSEGHDAIYVCVDRFTKMAHFIPTTVQVTAEETAHLYLRHVFKHHGLPLDIVSDRGPQFTSRLMSTLLELCDIKGNKST